MEIKTKVKKITIGEADEALAVIEVVIKEYQDIKEFKNQVKKWENTINGQKEL
jgi:hypothetical protein